MEFTVMMFDINDNTWKVVSSWKTLHNATITASDLLEISGDNGMDYQYAIMITETNTNSCYMIYEWEEL